MTKWLIPPLVGCVLLAGSGFLRALESTTDTSADIAVASREAPRSTAAAAEELDSLPALADITTHQADAFDQLARALEMSAQRVFALNDRLVEQADGIEEMRSGLAALGAPLSCVRSHIARLTEQGQAVPGGIRRVEAIIERIIGSQDKAIRHLRSINRKLIALGAVATASGVRPPPPPQVGEPLPVDPVDVGASCAG